jgi:hypothetical protein
MVHGDEMSTMCRVGLSMHYCCFVNYVNDVSARLTIYLDVLIFLTQFEKK